MSAGNFTFDDYRNTILEYLNQMKEYKNEGDSLSDFRSFLENFISIEFLNSEIFNKLLEIAWTHCLNEEKFNTEIEAFLSELRKKFQQATVLSKVIIAYQFLTSLAKSIFRILLIRKKINFL